MNWTHNSLMALKPEKDCYFNHDIDGLRLRVGPSSKGWRRVWNFRRMIKGEIFTGQIGTFPEITLSEAQEMAVEINRRIALGENPFKPMIEEEKLTAREAWNSYIDDRLRCGKSMVGCIQIGAKDIIPVVGDKALVDITSADIRKIVNRPIERGANSKGGGRARSNGVLLTTKAFLNWCIRQQGGGYEAFTVNPALGVQKVKAYPQKKHILTLRELALVAIAARKFDAERGDTNWSDIIRLLCYLGSRRSEILELPKSEWDTKERTWFLPAQRYKTDRDHDLPVGPRAAAIFDRLSREGLSSFMIKPQYGVRRGNTSRAVAGICNHLGEDFPKWTLHSLRYGFRSNIRKEGIADRVLAEQLIHPRAKKEFSEHYDPACPVEMREALTKWEARLDEEVSTILSENMRAVA